MYVESANCFQRRRHREPGRPSMGVRLRQPRPKPGFLGRPQD
jgi:hypothetical protein